MSLLGGQTLASQEIFLTMVTKMATMAMPMRHAQDDLPSEGQGSFAAASLTSSLCPFLAIAGRFVQFFAFIRRVVIGSSDQLLVLGCKRSFVFLDPEGGRNYNSYGSEFDLPKRPCGKSGNIFQLLKELATEIG
jgi:hypothetical protein